jgi:glycosyltransferase involved in cell wall biosynthesis
MAAADAPTYSIVTTCKGRLDDLKQSLPRFVAQSDAEVIVVDYDCPQKTAAYVRQTYPTVKVVSVTDRPLFNLPDARNCGVAEATGKVLVFLDADVIAAEDFLARLQFPVGKKVHGRFAPKKSNSLNGSCIVRREDFEAVGAYDELLSGYEAEDLDLYMRLRLYGTRPITVREDAIERVIEQSEEERLRFRPPEILRQFLRGQLYQLAKESVLRHRGETRIGREERQALMAQVDRQLDTTFTGEKDFELTVGFPDRYKRGFLAAWEFSTAVTVRARKKKAKK